MSKKNMLNRAVMAINNGMSIRSAHKKYATVFSYSTFYRRVKSFTLVVTPSDLLVSRLKEDPVIGSKTAVEIIKKYSLDIVACFDSGMSKKQVLDIINKIFGIDIGYSFFCRNTKNINGQKDMGNSSKKVASITSSNPNHKKDKRIDASKYTHEGLKGCDFLTKEERDLLVNGHNGTNVRDYVQVVRKHRENTELNKK